MDWARPSRRLLLVAPLILAACALPPNTALTDWAHRAAVEVDRPALLAGDDPALVAQQALAAYLRALSVLGEPERPLPDGDDAFAAPAARAGALAEPVARIGALLEAARLANLPPDARAMSAAPALLVEDHRLWRLLPAADGPLRQVIEGLSAPRRAASDPLPRAYAALLDAVAQDHAMLAARALHVRQEELARDLRAAEDRLVRRARLLPP